MVPLNLVLRGGTHPSRPRGSGDQRALIRRENIFPRRYRVFQANCSNTTIDYTCTFRGETLSPLEFDDLLEKNIGGEKKKKKKGLTPIRRHNGRKQNNRQWVWKCPIPWRMKASIRTYIAYAYDVVAIFSTILRNLCVYCNFSWEEFTILKKKKRTEIRWDLKFLNSRLLRDR